jgi:hypothetical protein
LKSGVIYRVAEEWIRLNYFVFAGLSICHFRFSSTLSFPIACEVAFWIADTPNKRESIFPLTTNERVPTEWAFVPVVFHYFLSDFFCCSFRFFHTDSDLLMTSFRSCPLLGWGTMPKTFIA